MGRSRSRRVRLRERCGLAEVVVARAPVVVGERGDALLRKGAREQARLHGAVDDHPRIVLAAPRQLAARRLALDERERRLQGVDVSDGLAAVEQLGREVGDPAPAHLALVGQRRHRRPRLLDRHAALVGPVELVEIDVVEAQTAQGRLTLATDRVRTEIVANAPHGVGLVPREAALREDVGTLSLGQRAHRPADDFLRVPVPVHGRRVDPVHAPLHRVSDGRDRLGVVLRSPAECPAASAERPRAQAEGRDLRPVPAEPAQWQRHRPSFLVRLRDRRRPGVSSANPFCTPGHDQYSRSQAIDGRDSGRSQRLERADLPVVGRGGWETPPLRE